MSIGHPPTPLKFCAALSLTALLGCTSQQIQPLNTPLNSSQQPLNTQTANPTKPVIANPAVRPDASGSPTPTRTALPNPTIPSQATPTPAPGATASPAMNTTPRPTIPPNLPIGSLPGNLPVQAPYNPSASAGAGDYRLTDSFLTDQDTFNQWQAVNVTISNNRLFVGAIDRKSPSKGTVIEMNLSGANWKDIGKSLLSTITFGSSGYKIGASLQGMATDAQGQLILSESSQQIFQLNLTDYKLTNFQIPFGGSRDLVFSNQKFYLASADGVKKLNLADKSIETLSPLIATGGMTTDSENYLYLVVGDAIQKLDPAGKAGIIIEGLQQARDVAVDSEGNIFVLESNQISWFNANGEAKGSFGQSEFSDPRAIAIDSAGDLYVADAGLDYTDSAILKFTPAPAQPPGL